MTARQQHGFEYQDYVIKQLNLKGDNNYIGKNDAYYKEENGINLPVLIKCIKQGSAIDLSDYRRNKNRNSVFILIVGFWNGEKTNVVEEYILYPPIEWWRSLFITPQGFDEEIYKFLNEISNDKSDDILWEKKTKEFKNIWNYSWIEVQPEFEDKWGKVCSERVVQLRFKRDHKTQKRIQCAIPNKKFYEYFITW